MAWSVITRSIVSASGERPQSRLAATGLDDRMAEVFEHRGGVEQDELVVVYRQDFQRSGQALRPSPAHRPSSLARSLAATGSQSSTSVPTPTRLLRRNVPPDCFVEAVDHGQAETGSFADPFGCEERLGGARQDLRAHSFALIGDRETNIVARRQVRDARADALASGGQGDRAAMRHRIARIDDDVQQRGFELSRIRFHGRKTRRHSMLR